MARLWSAEHPEQPIDADEMATWFGSHPEGKFFRRAAVRDADGHLIAGYSGSDTTPTTPPTRVVFDYWSSEDLDSKYFPGFVDESESISRELGSLNIGHWLRDSRQFRRNYLETKGYSIIQTVPATRLHVPSANLDPFRGKAKAVQARMRICSLAELEAEGLDWVEPLYESTKEMSHDVPSTDAWEEISLDQYRKMLSNRKLYNLDLMFVAMEGARVVGYTRVSPLPLKPDTARTGLSGVVRSHRRQGIITALKVACIEKLREMGIDWVVTDNDETNPLLELNKALGYTQFMAFLQYGKPLK